MFEMDTTTEDAALPTHCRQMPQLGRDGPWSRVFIADSWFGSVEAAVALGKRKMHFIGTVKTAHGGFPKQYIEGLLQPMPSGVCIVLESETDSDPALDDLLIQAWRWYLSCVSRTAVASRTAPAVDASSASTDTVAGIVANTVLPLGVLEPMDAA